MKPQKAPQPPTYLEKFQQLRRVIKGIDPARYDQSIWGYKTHCSTFMCIAGHAAHDTWFQAHGFEYSWNSHGMMWVTIFGSSPFGVGGESFFGRDMRFLFDTQPLKTVWGARGIGPSSLDEAKARCNATIAELEREEVTV